MDGQDNSKVYFSVKIGCQNCLGTPLEIDKNQPPEKRIKDLSGDHRIEYLSAGEYSSYVLIRNEKNESLFHMVLNKEGEIKVTTNGNYAITINPIDKNRANDLVDRINQKKSGSSWIPDFGFQYGPDGI